LTKINNGAFLFDVPQEKEHRVPSHGFMLQPNKFMRRGEKAGYHRGIIRRPGERDA
jgi:hypothetical protein